MSVSQPIPLIESVDLRTFLIQLTLLAVSALLLGRLTQRLGLTSIVGELSAGVLLGPSVLGNLAPALSGWLFPPDPAQFHMVEAVGQVGVLLLVGITGAHIDLSLVRRRGATVARVSLAGMLIPAGLGVAIGLAIPASLVPETADRGAFVLFLAVAMAVSAIPVIAKTLTELRLVHRNVGQLILCAVTVDDIIGWATLSVVSAMATTGVRAGNIALSIGSLLGVLVAAMLLRPVFRGLLRRAGRADGAEEGRVTIAVVVILVLLAGALTQAVKLEAVFGAFICGIVIGNCGALSYAKLAPLRATVMAFLAPLFFSLAGLRMDLTALVRPVVLVTGLIVLAAAILGKFAGAYLGARLSRLGHWEGLALGAGMNARGVIEVIIAMVGLRLGVLSVEVYTIIILVAMVTSLMAPPLLRRTMAGLEQTAEERLRAQTFDDRPLAHDADGAR
ncbi:cation:proton antiporter [Micromonospora sp. DT47]|uniref:cation:proton antiporter n=1 Tax=Micromonospora sp. DT47 TaxID=3393431 RepID=UPI003CEA5C59